MKLDVSVIDVDMSDSDVAITEYKTAKPSTIKINVLEKQVYGNKAFLMLNHEQAKHLIEVLKEQLSHE